MKTKYKIYETDDSQLRERERIDYKAPDKRIVLIETEFEEHSTMELAVQEIKASGKKYREYTILPVFYMTDFDEE